MREGVIASGTHLTAVYPDLFFYFQGKLFFVNPLFLIGTEIQSRTQATSAEGTLRCFTNEFGFAFARRLSLRSGESAYSLNHFLSYSFAQ